MPQTDPGRWVQLSQSLGVAEQVHFDGSRPAGPEVLEWLDAIDVHCQPSFQEGLPRATIEAMSRGCACLGSTAGGLPELLPTERTHAPGDAAGLAALMATMVASPETLAASAQRDQDLSREYLKPVLDAERGKLLTAFAGLARKHADEQTCAA